MSTKNVFYMNRVAHPVFFDIMAARSDVELTKLQDATPEAEVAPVLTRAHVYQIPAVRDEVARQYHANEALLARTPDLLLVSSTGVGFDTVDVDACTRAGVLAVNQAGGNSESVAEHVLGMILCLSKRIHEVDLRLRRASGVNRLDYMNHEVVGRTVGIVGIGNVGRRVAELCRGLFRMRVIACDPYLSAEEIEARGAEKVELADVMRQSDFVSVSCPLNDETRGMIGAAQYALMQKHAYFISTARGFIHDEPALAAALREGRIAGAGLDVWEKEPPPHDHPLLQFDNVIASPHIAGTTFEARHNTGSMAARQILDALDGKPVARLLNPEAWPAFAKKFERVFGFKPQR